jgi:hypothetical protein
MSTIQIPASLQTALVTVTNAAVSHAIAELAEKYGFDAEEAGRDLKIPDVNFKSGKAAKGFKKNGEPKKKRGTTGYLIFSKEQREEVKKEMEAALDEGEKLQPKLVVKRLAELWKGLTGDEQAVWNKRAAQANDAADSASATDSGSEYAASDAGSETSDKPKSKSKAIVPAKNVEKTEKTKGKEKAKPPADDEPKKKRAANAYLVWANANRAEVKAKMQAELEEGEKLKPTDVTKQLAANWKALSDGEKAEWKNKAEAEQSGDDSD